MNRRVFSDAEEKYTSSGSRRAEEFNLMNINVSRVEHRARIADMTIARREKEN